MTSPTEISSFREDLLSICGGLPTATACADSCRKLNPGNLPNDCRELLEHHEHMTTTLERFYREPVDLLVLEEKLDERSYHRQILLKLRESKTVVEFGIARLRLDQIPQAVRDEVLGRGAPLGDILIRHNVMREIEPRWFFEVDGGCDWNRHFDLAENGPLFGRLGEIRCDGVSAIEVLEVVSPRI